MTEDTWRRLEAMYAEFPMLAAEPGSEPEVEAISAWLGRPLPADYREFLLRHGGAMAGPYSIYGVRHVEVMGSGLWRVTDVNQKYREEGWPHADEWLIISEDHAGNPMGVAEDGRVLVWDHDLRRTYELGSSFEDFLRRECLGLARE
jgi:cell wall assembly regulator SMI1